MMKGIFILSADGYQQLYQPSVRQAIDELVDIIAPPLTPITMADHPDALASADVLFSGWGAPMLDEALLSSMLNLKAVFYAAGSIRNIVTPAFWEHVIPITSSAIANAVPVADYTLGQILFSLKGGWYYSQQMKALRAKPERIQHAGLNGSVVAIISLGMIGKRVCQHLKHFDVKVLVYDPFVDASTAEAFNVEMVSLDGAFAQADVVSLHTPNLPETRGLIKGKHFRLMKECATFINTARGAVVREDEMIKVLAERPEIYALLDVTHPEPPPPESVLYDLPNVVLTPHIAGAIDWGDLRRMGETTVAELKRFLNNEPLKWEVTHEKFDITA